MVLIFYILLISLSLSNIILKKKLLFNIIFFSMFTFSAFRVGIGTDYYNYLSIAERLLNGTIDKVYFGFPHNIFYMITYITKFTQTYFIISTVIVFYFLKKLLDENDKNKHLILLFIITSGFYFYSMNIIRQFMGISIFIYSLKHLNKNNIKFYLLNFFTVLMHLSLIIVYFVPIIIFFFKKTNNYIIYFILLFSLLFQEYILLIMEIFVENISLISKYSKYFDNPLNSLSIVQFIERIALLFVVFVLIFYKSDTIKKNKEIIIVFFFGVFLRNILHGQIGRIALTFLMVEIIIFPKFIERDNIKNYLISTLIIIYGLTRFVLFIYSNTANILGG